MSATVSTPLTSDGARTLALNARQASRTLKSLGYPVRQTILRALSDALTAEKNIPRILEANERDVTAAKKGGMTPANFARLKMDASKLATLATGLKQLSDPQIIEDPVNQLKKQTLIADGLTLQQRTVPLGVLLVIFESRPDVLPQLIGLSVLSSNGLLLKGGSECRHTLSLLYTICTEVITQATNGRVDGAHLVSLVTGRESITPLLALDDCIDLVIPRGGNSLVTYVKSHTKIPVLGHADGVCHMYLDHEYGGQANLENMIKIIVDSKVDYPAACNALETLLIHDDVQRHTGLTGSTTAVASIVDSLKQAGVKILLGPRAFDQAQTRPKTSPFRGLDQAQDLHTEYGDLTLCVELVPDIQAAIHHIHTYGSSHTESILTSSSSTAQLFLYQVDSACVFHNTSTRFADGYRMGLGAEVGISTSRIHARGPVGVEGLCTTKWQMVTTRPEGQPVGPFQRGEQKFIHQQQPITSKL